VLGNIRGKRPTMFLLGSVRGLVHHHHDACKWILLQIEGTRAGHGALYYQAYWAALSTTDYGAEFVVELSSQRLQKKFDWPQPLPMPDLTTFMTPLDTCLFWDPKLPEFIPALSNLKLVTNKKRHVGVHGVSSLLERLVCEIGRWQKSGAKLNYNPLIAASWAGSGI